MARPKPMVFSAGALNELANEIREHAAKVDAVAEQLRQLADREYGGRTVALLLEYHVAVNEGLKAIRNLVRDAEGKIDNGKIHDQLLLTDFHMPVPARASVDLGPQEQSHGGQGGRTPKRRKTPKESS